MKSPGIQFPDASTRCPTSGSDRYSPGLATSESGRIVLGRTGRRRVCVDRSAELPLAEPREDAGHGEAQQQHRDPARSQQDLAQRRREHLDGPSDRAPVGCAHGRVGLRHPPWYGATTTSTRWNSLRSEYPVVAIDLRRAPIRLAVPSATGAGP